MLTAGSLTIIITAKDKAAALSLSLSREFRIARGQAIFSQVRDIGTVGQQFSIRRHDMVSSDIITGFDQNLTGDLISQWVMSGERLDIRPRTTSTSEPSSAGGTTILSQ